MNILITGGGGYLGTVLVRRLLSSDEPYHHLTVLDRFSWGVQPLASVYTPQLRIVRGDIRREEDVRTAMRAWSEPPDVVFHLAGIVGYPACDADPEDAETTNVDGTQRVCRLTRPARQVFASTGSTYGRVVGECTEETPISPLTRYGRTKAAAERFVLDQAGTALRLATLFGISPRMRWDLLVQDFCRRAVKDKHLTIYEGEAWRTFLHVEDAAEAFCRAVGWEPGVYNVGSSDLNYRKRQVAESIGLLTGCTVTEGEGHDPDLRDYFVSYQKVSQLWQPRRTLIRELPRLIELARVW